MPLRKEAIGFETFRLLSLYGFRALGIYFNEQPHKRTIYVLGYIFVRVCTSNILMKPSAPRALKSIKARQPV